ncbi:MAG: hypothetical protein IT382_01800 [Deltaproteobacteria bacterium]|nr:hypothetical protein [Deltaproteobacteria bacterium]
MNTSSATAPTPQLPTEPRSVFSAVGALLALAAAAGPLAVLAVLVIVPTMGALRPPVAAYIALPAALDQEEDHEAKSAGPMERSAVLTVTAAANVAVRYSASWEHAVARCIVETTGVPVYIVNQGDADTSAGTGPFCDSCRGGATLPPIGHGYLRTSGGLATVRCSFNDGWAAGMSFPPSSGGGAAGLSSGAADAAYLRLDGSNDPITGDVYFGVPAGNSVQVDGANAFLWTQVLDSDATGNFSSVGTTAWDGTQWDAATVSASYGESYPRNGYCTSAAQAPGSSEIWINGDPTSESRLCAPVGTGMDLGVSNGDGTTFENVLALTGTGAVLNDDGAADLDLVWESDTNASAFHLDATGAGALGVGNVAGSASTIASAWRWLGPAGSAAAPAMSFSTDTNTGFYRSGADAISWSTGGTQRGVLNSNEANFYMPLSVDAGSAAAPSIRFSADNDTGLYSDTANTVRVAGGGTRAASIAAGAFVVYDTDGTTTLFGAQTGAAFTGSGIDFTPGADNTSDLGLSSYRWNQVYSEKLQNGAATAGSSALELNDDVVCPQQSTSSAPNTFRLPAHLASDVTSNRPTCSTSADAGKLLYIDDTDDTVVAGVCVCGANAANAYGWRSINNFGVNCHL